MTTCIRRQAPEGAVAFARDQLWLARGLEPFLAGAFHAERWEATTMAGPAISDDRLARFSEGGSLCAPDAVTQGMLSVVRDAMARQSGAAWLVPDPMGKPDDPLLARVAATWLPVDGAVYYVERRPDVSQLAAIWRQASSAAGQLGLVTTHEIPAVGPTTDDLKEAAALAVLVAISAYDGDGVLLLEDRTRRVG